VTGEVRVGKRTLEDTEQVSEELRHQELKVEKAGDVNLQDNVLKEDKANSPAGGECTLGTVTQNRVA
jgi:hypothetical protein